MKRSDIPVPNPVAVLREESDDWAILFNPDTSEALGVNPVGVRVWKLLDGKASVEDIDRRVRESFRDVPADSAGQVRTFVDELRRLGFVADG